MQGSGHWGGGGSRNKIHTGIGSSMRSHDYHQARSGLEARAAWEKALGLNAADL